MRVPMAMLALSCLLLGILPTYVIPVLDKTITPLLCQHFGRPGTPVFYHGERGCKV